MGRRRRDRWTPGPAHSLPVRARGDDVHDVEPPVPVLAWVHFHAGHREVHARAIAHTSRAVLVEWGFGQAADAAWVWRDAVRVAVDRTEK